MKRPKGSWIRLLSFRMSWASRRFHRRSPRPHIPQRTGRLRRQAVHLDLQPLEPKLALAASVTATATAVVTPAPGSYNAGDDLVFQVQFNSPVIVTGAPTVNLVIGRSNIPATYLGGSGSNVLSFHHVVSAGENDTDGITVGKSIMLRSGDSILDSRTKPASLALSPPSTANILVDTASPAVSSVMGPAAKTYGEGQLLSFTVNFTEPVFVTGSPALPIAIGNVVREATWNGSGSGSRSLVFTTTAQAGDSAPSGVRIEGPLVLADGATIRDLAGNDANPAARGTFFKAIVDAVGPSVTFFGSPVIDAATKVVSLQVTFSEPVIVVGKGLPFIPFTLNGVPKQLAYASGSGKNVLTFSYKPATGEMPSAQNVVVSASMITLTPKSAITDKLGNAMVPLTKPTDITLPTLLPATSIVEIAENNTEVGRLSTTDPDAGDRFTYAFVDGDGATDNGAFDKDTITGGLLKAITAFDYETRESYSVRIRSTDSSGLFTEKAFTIHITDVNETPTAVVLANATTSIAEGTSTATAIKLADIRITDDVLGSNGVSLSGPNAAVFAVYGSALYLKADTPLVAATNPSYSVTVSVADPRLPGSTPVTTDYKLTIVPSPSLFTYTRDSTSVTITGYIGPRGSVTIPATIEGKPVTTIATRAFSQNQSVTSVVIPSSVKTIGYESFSGCVGLQSVVIPASVTTIDTRAFSGCTALQSVTIPAGVATIGLGAFSGCTGLQSLTILQGVGAIGVEAFSGCTGLGAVTIPSSVTTIDTRAFSGCTGVQGLTIERGIVTVGYESFSGCTGLVAVTIPSGVTTIGVRAFSGCTGLQFVTIPAGVTTINLTPFTGCSSLVSLTFLGDPPSLSGTYLANAGSSAIVIYPADAAAWSAYVGTTFGGLRTRPA